MSVASTTLAETMLGFRASVPLEFGLASMSEAALHCVTVASLGLGVEGGQPAPWI